MRHFVLAALCAATAINYTQRNSISGAETTIRKALDLQIAQTGDAIGAFFLAYALFQIPSGWLAQKLTPRWALALYAAGWSLATGVCALATGVATLVGARLVMGALQAGIFPCATMILLVWYPAKRRALATAILNSFMLIGGAVGSMLTGVLLGPVGWRGLFVVYALPGLVWALWFAWWFRNRPSEHPGVNAAELELLDGDRPKVVELDDQGARATSAAERSFGGDDGGRVGAGVDGDTVNLGGAHAGSATGAQHPGDAAAGDLLELAVVVLVFATVLPGWSESLFR